MQSQGDRGREKRCPCGKSAGAHCKRCGKSYCSRKCQEEHWPAHKKDCAPPQAAAAPESVVALPENSGLTALLYSAIVVLERGGRRWAVAAAPVRRGDILLVEFVCTAPETVLQVAVNRYGHLFAHLWPRPPADAAAPETAAARAQLAYDKSRLNVFGIQPFFDSELNPQYLGLHLSMLDHDADFNCAIDTVRPQGSELGFAVVVAQRDIPAGAALTIDYGPGYPEPFVEGNCYQREADYKLFRPPLDGRILAHLRESAELIYAVLPQQARLLTMRGIPPSVADGGTIETEITVDAPAAARLHESFERDIRRLLAGKVPLVSDTLSSLSGDVVPLSLGVPNGV